MPDAETPPWRRRLIPILAAVAVVAVAATIPVWAPGGAGSASRLSASQLSPARPSPSSAPSPAPTVTVAQLARDHWSRIAPAPIPTRAQAAAVWTGTRMLVWGGAINDQLRDDGAAYDPASDSWTTLPAAPISGRTGMASVWTGSQWFIWGGYDTIDDVDPHVSAAGALFDPASNAWRKLPPSPLSARAGATALWVDGKVFVLGGQPALGSAAGADRDMAAYDPATNRWEKRAALPLPKSHDVLQLVATATGGKIYVWEEWQHTVPQGKNATMTTAGIDLYIYDPASDGWTADRAASRFPTGPPDNDAPLGIDAAVPIDGAVITPGAQAFCGACPRPMTTNRKGALLDIATNTWTTLPHGPVDDLNPTSVWTGDALLSFDTSTFMSGPDGTRLPGEAAAWDPANDAWTPLPSAPLANASVAVWAGDRLIEWGSMFVPSEAGGGSPPAQHDAGLAFGP